MAVAIGLRSDYTADGLWRLAKASRDAKQTRRPLSLAAIHAGGSRTEAGAVRRGRRRDGSPRIEVDHIKKTPARWAGK